MKAAADTLKRISLELGGKSPNIVFADADLEMAVKGAIRAIFRSQGQSCVAGSRLFLQDAIYDRFMSGSYPQRTNSTWEIRSTRPLTLVR